jgi:peptide/nickel transport system permease protein
MRTLRAAWRMMAALSAMVILGCITALVAYGLTIPDQWWKLVFAGGSIPGTERVEQAPFPALSFVEPFDLNLKTYGTHLYLLGSDAGGRDIIALVAHAVLPSLGLVALVVATRFVVGTAFGVAIAVGSGWARALSRAAGSWLMGFPYLALAIVVIEALEPSGKLQAFVVGMALVGWRDIADLVAERIEYVRAQPFATAARALGTSGGRFLQLHVAPFLRPAIIVELTFQASAVIVLLAELGYLQVYVGPVLRLQQAGDNSIALLTNPELGQLLADSQRNLLYHQVELVLVPALMIGLLAMSFELLGTALRGRTRFQS